MGLIVYGGLLAAILLAIGVLSLISPKVRTFLQVIPLFKPQITGIILIALGLIFGGVAGMSGMFAAASIGGNADLDVEFNEVGLDCVYLSGTPVANTTYKRSSTEFSAVTLKVKANSTTGSEINMTFECDIENSNIDTEREVTILVKGDIFQSEVNAFDTNEYNILDTTTDKSRYFSPEKEQVIYLATGTEATASDSVERLKLSFAKGSSTATFSILGDLSQIALAQLEEDTQRNVVLTSDGSTIAQVNVIKAFA